MRKSPLAVIFLTILLDLLGFGILIPVIPQLFITTSPTYVFAGLNITHEMRLATLELLVASYPFATFISAPILGQLSDKYGRKRILAICLSGTALSYFVFAWGIMTQDLTLLFLSRIVDGLTGGNIAVAQAVIADISTPQNRTKNFGLVGAAFGIGFILGPVIGGMLSSSATVSWFSATTPFIFAGILSIINVLSVVFQLPETHPQIRHDLVISPTQSLTHIMRAFRMRATFPIFMTMFLFQGGFTMYTTFASTYLFERFDFTEQQTGMFFAYVGVWIVITQAIILRRISGRISEARVVKYALFVIAASLGVYTLADVWWQLLLLVPVYAIPIGLVNASLTSLISRSVSREMQGEIMGIQASVLSLAQSLPQTVITMVSLYILHRSFSPGTSIVVASCIIGAAAIYYAVSYRSHVAAGQATDLGASGMH